MPAKLSGAETTEQACGKGLMRNEDFTQPFYVPPKMAKRSGWSGAGYLPPLAEKRFPIEPTPVTPVQDFFLLGRLVYLQHKVELLEKTSHTHSHKKKDDYIIQ